MSETHFEVLIVLGIWLGGAAVFMLWRGYEDGKNGDRSDDRDIAVSLIWPFILLLFIFLLPREIGRKLGQRKKP